jgi:hypothetical protein
MESNTLLAFLKKASEDEGLRKELVALAGRYGVQLGSDELSDAALDQVAGGLLPAVNLISTNLQTTLLSPVAQIGGKIPTIGKWSKLGSTTFKLGDGSV